MPDRVAMTLRIDRGDHELLRQLSFEYRLPISEIIRRATHLLLSSPTDQGFLLGTDEEEEDQ